MKVFKVDVQANPAAPARLAIRGVPTLLILKEGRVVQQLLGAVTKTRLVAAISAALSG